MYSLREVRLKSFCSLPIITSQKGIGHTSVNYRFGPWVQFVWFKNKNILCCKKKKKRRNRENDPSPWIFLFVFKFEPTVALIVNVNTVSLYTITLGDQRTVLCEFMSSSQELLQLGLVLFLLISIVRNL